MTLQHNASPSGVAPYTTRPRRRRSAGSTLGADVCSNPCCGTTWPSEPRARCAPMHARGAWLGGRAEGRRRSGRRWRRQRFRNCARMRHIGVERQAKAAEHAVGRHSGASLVRDGTEPRGLPRPLPKPACLGLACLGLACLGLPACLPACLGLHACLLGPACLILPA